MKETKKMDVTCSGCQKKFSVTAGAGHTTVVVCPCGTEMTIQGEPGPMMDQLNDLLAKASPIIKDITASKRKGFQTGMDAGIHDEAYEVTRRLLSGNDELKEAFLNETLEALRGSLLREPEPEEDEGEEGPEPPPRA